MDDAVREQTLALAALFQALSEIRRTARSGQCNGEDVTTCLNGLLLPFDGSVGDAFGGEERLLPGLQRLRDQLADPRDTELTRYAVVLMHLERKLMRRRRLLSELADGLAQAQRQAEHFDNGHENVISGLADLYARTVSSLRPQILVQGERRWLEDTRNAERVRALLLASIRAITLWRNAGGSRVRLILGRNRLQQASEQLAREVLS